MSVTTPTLICLPCGCVDSPPPPEPPSSSPPHAATPNAATAMVRAMAIARNVLRCTAPPLLSSSRARPGPGPGRSLRPWAVVVAQSRQERFAQVGLREARLDRGAGDLAQRGVVQAEAVAGDRVLAAHAGAEVGRVVGAERDPDAGLAQRG